MALRDLVVLAVLLSSLLALHQVMEAMITDYTRVHIQKRRLGAFFGSMTTWITTIIRTTLYRRGYTQFIGERKRFCIAV